jgi:polyisoprenoid-binding protein YceI
VDTNYPITDKDFDAQVANQFLEASDFPAIEFVSTKVEPGPDNNARITGNLTFHGVLKPVVLQAKLNGSMNPNPITKGPGIGFSATGSIKRSEFGATARAGPIGDDVEISIETEFLGS